MTTNQKIDGVPRELLERLRDGNISIAGPDFWAAWKELRALLDAPVRQHASREGKRERFEKWVMGKNHPVYGFLDGRSLARGDDRTGYADEYVQGLWVAYLEFGAQPQGEPVAVMYEDGSVLTKAECGIAFETCCRVETPLYAEQPAPVADLLEQLEQLKAENKQMIQAATSRLMGEAAPVAVVQTCCGSCPGGCVVQVSSDAGKARDV